MRILCTWSLFVVSATCSSTVHHSFISPSSFLSPSYAPPPSPMSPSLTSTTGSTYAAHGEADHAPTCAYRLVSFRLAYLADAILRFSHWISIYSNDALNLLRIIASATYLRGHVLRRWCQCRIPTPNTARCCLLKSTADDITRQIAEHVRRAHTTPATCSATATPAPITLTWRHCERRCDYHLFRSHSATLMALFMSVLVQPPRIDINTRSLFDDRQKYEDEVKTGGTLRDTMQGCPYRPPRTHYRPISPTVLTPRPPVRFCIYFIAYE